MQPFTFNRPRTPEEAVAAFAAAGPGARYLAGGTSLYDLMKLGVERPTHLVDVSGVAGLDAIRTSGQALRFGAGARMADVAGTPIVRDEYPVLAESLLKAASQQLRNMATVGGNLLQRARCAYFRAGPRAYPCNKHEPGSGCAAVGGLDRGHAVLGASDGCSAVAPGDWPVALTALDARVELLGPKGRRSMPIGGLYRAPGDTPHREFTLEPGELITTIVVPKTAAGRASTYQKIRDRESFAFALASAAVALRMDGPMVREARIALGGVGTVPWRVPDAEAALHGAALTPDTALAAGRIAMRSARAGRHNAFKKEIGARVVAEALMIAATRGGARS